MFNLNHRCVLSCVVCIFLFTTIIGTALADLPTPMPPDPDSARMYKD